VATPVEKQIHNVLIAREEERCRALEAKTGKPVKRRDVPMPWKRIGPHAILQDPEFLQHVTEFAYDLDDPTFQEYCRSRGVLHVAGEPGRRRWEYCLDHAKTRDEFLADPFFRCAEPYGDKRYEYTPEEMNAHWRIVCLGRAALQDCWELYRRESLVVEPPAAEPLIVHVEPPAEAEPKRAKPKKPRQKPPPRKPKPTKPKKPRKQKNEEKANRQEKRETKPSRPTARRRQGEKRPKASTKTTRAAQLVLFEEGPAHGRKLRRRGR